RFWLAPGANANSGGFIMARKSSYLISGLAAMAAMIVALPAAEGIGAAKKEASPLVQVNRASKGNRLVHPLTVVVRKPAVRARRVRNAGRPRPAGADQHAGAGPTARQTRRQAAEDHGRLRTAVQSGRGAVNGPPRRPLRGIIAITFACGVCVKRAA